MYKTTIPPIMTFVYSREQRQDITDIAKTTTLRNNRNMVLRLIARKSLMDTERNKAIRPSCKSENINERIPSKRK